MGFVSSPKTNLALRLALESLVIIASILAAFALDTWWDGVQERREEREALEALRAEFSAARENIEYYRSLQARILTSVRSLTDSLNNALVRGDDSVAVPDTALSWAYIPPTTTVTLGTLEGLISSGRLGIIEDRELRTLLGSWGVELAELAEEEVESRALATGDMDRTFRARMSTYGLWLKADSVLRGTIDPRSAAGVRPIPVDTEMLGVLQLRLNILDHAMDEFDPLLESVDSILARIDASL